MTKTTASKFKKIIGSIYPSFFTRLHYGSNGWEVHQSGQDGSYLQRMRDEESCEDFIRIHQEA